MIASPMSIAPSLLASPRTNGMQLDGSSSERATAPLTPSPALPIVNPAVSTSTADPRAAPGSGPASPTGEGEIQPPTKAE